MIFENQDQALQSNETSSRVQESFAEIYENDAAITETIEFRFMAKFFNLLSEARGGSKGRLIKKFITTLFKKNRKYQYTFSILRLIIPGEDKVRGNYGLKQKALAKLMTQCLNLNKSQYERLYHYKNPNYHQQGMGIGDFSICMYDVIKGYMKSSSTLTIKRLNEILDQLANNIDQVKYFRELIKETNAAEMKWVVRIILKDLKLGIKLETVLTTFHPDGNDYYNLVTNLQDTCKKFENPKVSLNDDVELFHPIRPMLAGKKKIQYFKNQTRTFYLETKYDGQRLQVHYDRQRAKLFSRNGVDYNLVYEDFVNVLNQVIMADACILDGEIIVIDSKQNKMMPFGLNKPVALQHQTENLQLCYKIFDIMWLKVENDEMNLMGYPLRERKKILPKVITEIPGRVELVKFRQILQYDDILRQFNASLERNQEGVMLKDPNSIYVPKERAANWLKLKGDYVDGMTDTLDVIILGGYFGDLSFRQGKEGAHWTNQITSFLVGVLQNNDGQETIKYPYALPFCRVGMGFSQEELIQLRARLKPFLYEYNGKNKPEFLRCQWKYTITNKPDCYINNLKNSVILQVKAAQIQYSQNYATDCTLRFSRVVKVRYDKDWSEAMTKLQLDDLMNEANYTKTMKRKNQQPSDSDAEKQPDEMLGRRRKKQDSSKPKKPRDAILDQYTGVDVSNQKLVSHLFHNKEFNVLPLQNCGCTKAQIEKQIWLNDGKVVQNPLKTTHFIVANQIDYRIMAFERYELKKFTFIKPKYILGCIMAQRILPLSPLYLTILPSNNSTFYKQNFDRFGDSYTANLDQRELNEILLAMGSGYEINQSLMKTIGFNYSRSNKISLCFGVREIDKVKLKYNGNIIVESFEEKPNSIIISQLIQLTPALKELIEHYLKFEEAELEYIQNLVEQNVI